MSLSGSLLTSKILVLASPNCPGQVAACTRAYTGRSDRSDHRALPASDLSALRRVSQFGFSGSSTRPQVIDSEYGEMSEWLKEHVWRANPPRLTEEHEAHRDAIGSTTYRLSMPLDVTP